MLSQRSLSNAKSSALRSSYTPTARRNPTQPQSAPDNRASTVGRRLRTMACVARDSASPRSSRSLSSVVSSDCRSLSSCWYSAFSSALVAAAVFFCVSSSSRSACGRVGQPTGRRPVRFSPCHGAYRASSRAAHLDLLPMRLLLVPQIRQALLVREVQVRILVVCRRDLPPELLLASLRGRHGIGLGRHLGLQIAVQLLQVGVLLLHRDEPLAQLLLLLPAGRDSRAGRRAANRSARRCSGRLAARHTLRCRAGVRVRCRRRGGLLSSGGRRDVDRRGRCRRRCRRRVAQLQLRERRARWVRCCGSCRPHRGQRGGRGDGHQARRATARPRMQAPQQRLTGRRRRLRRRRRGFVRGRPARRRGWLALVLQLRRQRLDGPISSTRVLS